MELHEVLTQLDGMTPRRRAAFALTLPRQIWWLLRPGSEAGPVSPGPGGAPATPQERRAHLRKIYLGLDAEHVLRPYAGPVTLLWPAEDPIEPAKAARWWRRVAPRVDVRVVPGTHATCLTEHVGAAVEALRHCLRSPGADGSGARRRGARVVGTLDVDGPAPRAGSTLSDDERRGPSIPLTATAIGLSPGAES
jgi:pimeloyl-ACP methyl ester carboxylesterase